jgi:hypothetical protein
MLEVYWVKQTSLRKGGAAVFWTLKGDGEEVLF